MGSQLQQVLWSLCFNSGWKYAVFWKLKHRARMMLAWEDAYYDSHESPDQKWFNSTMGSFSEASHLHDPLGLVVANMSYEVYSLGEGIVGQVAISGKHAWIFSDQHDINSSSSSEHLGGWQTQFSAGVKTIAVVPVIPHGVVQLGSLHKIAEDLKLVDHIKNVFCGLQEAVAGCISSSLKSKTENYCLSDNYKRVPDSTVPDCLARFKSSLHEDEVNLWSLLYPITGESDGDSHIKTNCDGGVGNEISCPSSSQNIPTSQLGRDEREANDLKDVGKGPEEHAGVDKSSSLNSTLPTNESTMGVQNQWHQDFENLEFPFKPGFSEMHISPFSFGAGYELYEAMGQSFPKQNDYEWDTGKTSPDMAIEISEGIGSCSLMPESSDTHLLDAVVAKVSHKRNEKPFHENRGSHLTADKTLGTITSGGYSFDKDASSSLNSVMCGVESFKGFSSTSCSSRGSEHLGRPREGVKSKKRAKPGESSRPRPRDRQLIQDRIKELRELIPSGSKCSIDSLLERTIKHMLFLQSVTKHAEKLNKCSASKLLDKDAGMRRFSCREQGSSWAMEVGYNDQKVYPIIVENISMNGQMLVEMLCEECSQFLEIAEAIRGLGLTILKGVSEAYGNKTWMCFVVENNRSLHRMDILWSLMQLLQPKIIAQ